MKRRRYEDIDDNGFASWGGYMAAKKSKLLEQFSEETARQGEGKSDIFRGVSIFVNGYTVPSADELKHFMMQHGGVYHQYQTQLTTHVIASNLPQAKMKQVKTSKIVKPDWIVESIKAGRLLDYRHYLLYNLQPTLNFDKVKPKYVTKETVIHEMPPDVDKLKEKSPPRPITKTAAKPEFLSEFYSNSRLHHISTMGAMFKQYVNELREGTSGRFPGRDLLRQWKSECPAMSSSSITGRVIMHIDMDCFFVSVGLRDRPHLRNFPVAVTHGKGNRLSHRNGANRAFEVNHYRQKVGLDPVEDVDETDSLSEIASCNYEARKCGLKNGMFLGTALKLCPNLKTIPYDFEGYKQVSYCLYDTVASFTLNIEAVSCDEMFVDCSVVLYDTNTTPLEFAEFLRQQIKTKTGCTASAGFGSNRLQARLATKKAKPNGHFYLEPIAVPSFMLDIKVEDLPGVGSSLAGRLKAMQVYTCADLKSKSLTQLQKEFGAKTGSALYKHCRGEDDRDLNFGHERKSVSAEINYGIRFTSNDEVDKFILQLSSEVASRLQAVKSRGHCITLKLMHSRTDFDGAVLKDEIKPGIAKDNYEVWCMCERGINLKRIYKYFKVRAKDAPVETAKYLGHGVCDHVTRSSTLSLATEDKDVIAREVMKIFRQLGIKSCDLRGIGIQISSLVKGVHKKGALDAFLKRAAPSNKQEICIQREDKQKQIVPEHFPPQNIPENILEAQSISEKRRETNTITEDILCNNMQQSDQTAKKNLEPPVCLYSSMNDKEVRTLVKEWVSSEDVPQACDVDMLADYLEKQVISQNIDALDVIVKCLCRCIHKKESQEWGGALSKIMNRVQQIMLLVYGAKLKCPCY